MIRTSGDREERETRERRHPVTPKSYPSSRPSGTSDPRWRPKKVLALHVDRFRDRIRDAVPRNFDPEGYPRPFIPGTSDPELGSLFALGQTLRRDYRRRWRGTPSVSHVKEGYVSPLVPDLGDSTGVV